MNMSKKEYTEVFARGPENNAYAKYFVGQSYLNILSKEGLVSALHNHTTLGSCIPLNGSVFSSRRKSDSPGIEVV